MNRRQPLLAARGVARRFGAHTALEATDLEIHRGEVVALVGANGAGKSTLLAILAGALEPSAGAVERVDGASIGWAPQRPGVYGRLTPRENLRFFARLAAVDGAVDSDLPERPASELSVGERQRLSLAVAFLGSPEVLLLDEPTASLDLEHREELWVRVSDLRASGGAVVFATQNPDEVERHADRVASLEDGRLRS